MRPKSSFKKIKSKIVKLHRPEPPYEKNGNGIPITGTSPMTIPTFIITWNAKIDATQYP